MAKNAGHVMPLKMDTLSIKMLSIKTVRRNCIGNMYINLFRNSLVLFCSPVMEFPANLKSERNLLLEMGLKCPLHGDRDGG